MNERQRKGKIKGEVGVEVTGGGGGVIPGRSLGAWDHLAWRRWGACCPSLGWALLLRSETHRHGG